MAVERVPFKFPLGATLRCQITGFTGTAITRSEWLYNCNTYGLKSKELKDGKPMDAVWFDEDQLELVPNEPAAKAGRPTGGPITPVPQTNR